tara:strand:+ start:1302 stop:1505 length:204 start_codon:yes stop_codon:yes gene_type:complete
MSNTVYIIDDKGNVESFTDVIALMKYLDSEFTLGCLPDDHTWTTSDKWRRRWRKQAKEVAQQKGEQK